MRLHVEQRRLRRRALALLPRDVRRRHIAAATGPHGAQRGLRESGRREDEPVAKRGRRHHAFPFAEHAPKSCARFRIEPLDRIARATHQLIAHHHRRHMRDARKSPRPAPPLASRGLVEREDHRLIPRHLPADFRVRPATAAVERHDEQIAVQQRRRPEAVLAVVLEIAIRPRDRAVEIHRCETAVGKNREHFFAIGHGRRRRVRILVLLVAGHLTEDFGTPHDAPVLPVEREHAATRALVRRRR